MKGTFITQRVPQCFGRTQDFPGRFLHSNGPRVHISIVTCRGFQRRKTLILLLSPAGAHFFKGARPLLQPNSSKMGGTAKKGGSNGNVLLFQRAMQRECVEHPPKTIPQKALTESSPWSFLNRVG